MSNNSGNTEKESNFLQYGTDYKKNHSKLIEELDREGFIYNASFYEEIETYILNKENEILTGYQNLNENDKNYQNFDSYKRDMLNKDTDYLRAIGHHMGAIQKAQKIKKFIKDNDKQKEKMKKYKQIKGLKYNDLKIKINNIQLSVIFLSIALTFLESLHNILEIENIAFSIIPIVISGYISFVTAIGRFFKYEDNKETLVKLDEKQSFIINRLAYREVLLKRMLPITRFSDQNKINNMIELDFTKDGLDEMISQTYQEYDINMSYTDKIQYKEEWLKMKNKDVTQQICSKNLQRKEKSLKNISTKSQEIQTDEDKQIQTDEDKQIQTMETNSVQIDIENQNQNIRNL